MKKLRSLLNVLFTPTCWIQNDPYSKVWDTRLRRLMQDHKFTNVTEHYAEIGGVTLWVANHPYASFTPCDIKVRPSRTTILAAHEKMVADTIDNKPKG